jgi:hypothetical protein
MSSETAAGGGIHKRRTTLNDGEEDVDPVVAQLGQRCAKLYIQLEECLGENDRDWRKCQKGRGCLTVLWTAEH